MILGDWLTITVWGTPMSQLWSFSMMMSGNILWPYGGCAGSDFFNTFAAIYLDVSLSASNFYANGTGIRSATSGVDCIIMLFCYIIQF